MKIKALTLSLALSCMSLQLQAAMSGAFPQPGPAELTTQCEQMLGAARNRIAELEKLPLPQVTLQNTLQAWNRLDILVQDVSGPANLLAEVSPDAAVRKAAEECELKLASLFTKAMQSPELYQRFKALQVSDPIDVLARQQTLDEFEQSGVNLPPEPREQVRQIMDRLTKLSQDFSRNLRDNKTRLTFEPAELTGVYKEFLARAKRDEQGRYLIGFDAPESEAILGFAESEAVRKRYLYEYNRRGGDANLAILGEVVKLRKQLAQLMGFASYADYALKQRMAATPAEVNRFLAEVQQQVAPIEQHDLAELSAEKIRHLNDPQAKLQRWDFLFYEQRIRKARYSIDPQAVRNQFPTEPTVAWLLKVTSTLYGLEFVPNPQLPKWYAEVRGYDVYDAGSGAYLSSFYLDLFPRDGKYKHAAAFAVRSGSVLEHRTPVSALVTNFSRDGFSQDELETLFHEFGHVMHGVLSQTRYSLNAGTSVKRDFVEAPSQMYEEWVRRPEAFKLFAQICPNCKPIDLGLVDRLNQARHFGQGTRYARQRLFAAYDMALASANPGEPMQVWRAMESATPLGHFDGTQFPGTFGHIVGGYAAGYYGYMWSEVLALDMASAFGNNLMNPEIGARYRKIVLENGGQVDPNRLVSEFLGRKPNSLAFFQHISAQPTALAGPAAVPGKAEEPVASAQPEQTAGAPKSAGLKRSARISSPATPASTIDLARPSDSAPAAEPGQSASVAKPVEPAAMAEPPKPVTAPAASAPAATAKPAASATRSWPMKPIEQPKQPASKVELRVGGEVQP
ncbi:MAG: M3 family metallopeptidase [Chitinivorax sp.]